MRQRPPVGMELLTGLEQHQVAASLRVGELNLVTWGEWPASRSDHAARVASGGR